MLHVDLGDKVWSWDYDVRDHVPGVVQQITPNPKAPPGDGSAQLIVMGESGQIEIRQHQVTRVRAALPAEYREQRIRAEAIRVAAWRFLHAPNVPAHMTRAEAAEWLTQWAIGEDHMTEEELATLEYGDLLP